MNILKKVLVTIYLIILVFFNVENLVSAQVSVTPNKSTQSNAEEADKAGLAPYKPLARVPGIEVDETGAAKNLNLPSYIRVLVRIAIGLIGVLSVVMIIIGGVQYMSTDAFSGKEDGKERVTQALKGLVLAVAAVFVLRTINPQLITLQITDDEFNKGVEIKVENLGIPEEFKLTKEDITAFNNSNNSTELVVRDLNVSISDTIKNEYIPALEKALPTIDKKLKTLLIAHTMSEGFKPGTMAYRTNNPGNIGNVGKNDQGIGQKRTCYENLSEGIKRQYQHITKAVLGQNPAYKKGRLIKVPNNIANPPGESFTYNDYLWHYLYVYAPEDHAKRSAYLSSIISTFKKQGIIITKDTTMLEIYGSTPQLNLSPREITCPANI